MASVRESDVVKQVVEYLFRLGWTPKRNHVGLFYTAWGQEIKIGEPGECDWVFLRPDCVLYLEIKRPGEKPSKEQREFIAKRRHQGFLADWTDSLEKLKEILRAAGLPS